MTPTRAASRPSCTFLDALAHRAAGRGGARSKLDHYRPGWASTWREHFPPVRVGRRLLITPSWTSARELKPRRRRPHRAARRSRRLRHRAPPATRGCLVALGTDLRRKGSAAPAALDVGCGTGVLTGRHADARRLADVVGVDTDPVACASTLEVRRSERRRPRARAALARPRARTFSTSWSRTCSRACSIIRWRPQLAAHTTQGGHLVVAGSSHLEGTCSALERAGFRLLPPRCRATWTMLTLERA